MVGVLTPWESTVRMEEPLHAKGSAVDTVKSWQPRSEAFPPKENLKYDGGK